MRSTFRPRSGERLAWAAGVWLMSAVCAGPGAPAAEAPEGGADEGVVQMAQMEAAMEGSWITLQPGEVRNLPAAEVVRVAIGDPEVIDVSIVSANEVLLQAKRGGRTNLILWDRQGAQRASTVEVIDPRHAEEESRVREALADMALTGAQVKRDGQVLIVTGQVDTDEQLGRVEQLLASIEGAQNLSTVRQQPPPPPEALIKLTVQLVELNRRDLEQLGVKWDQEIGFTHPAVGDLTFTEALTSAWGTGVSRTGLTQTLGALVQKNRARLLAEPKLVTISGVAAETFVGIDVPIIEGVSGGSGGVVTTGIGFRSTGVKLTVTPTLKADRQISTVVSAEASDIDDSVAINATISGSSVAIPGFQVRRASTQVSVNSGETILIAGLLKTEDSHVVNQVPALGSIPIVGRLFRSPKTETKQRELLITVTPELLSDGDLDMDKSLALEQALARTQVTVVPSDPLLQYAAQVQDKIARVLSYPPQQPPMKGRVTLRLHLLQNGELAESAVATSSGMEQLDRSALAAARSQAPYPPFPSDLSQLDVWLELPVVFSP